MIKVGPLGRTISKNVKMIMAARNISQDEMGRAVGWSQSQVGARLNGATHWTANDIEMVAMALDIDPAHLLRPVEQGFRLHSVPNEMKARRKIRKAEQ